MTTSFCSGIAAVVCFGLVVTAGTPAAAQTVINSAQDLQNMQNNLAGSYVLGGNVDASNANGGQGFVPIGSLSQPFTGTLDGAGYAISGLTIYPNTAAVGLFARLGACPSIH